MPELTHDNQSTIRAEISTPSQCHKSQNANFAMQQPERLFVQDVRAENKPAQFRDRVPCPSCQLGGGGGGGGGGFGDEASACACLAVRCICTFVSSANVPRALQRSVRDRVHRSLYSFGCQPCRSSSSLSAFSTARRTSSSILSRARKTLLCK